jgi:glycosyltransferase involved in cell wall biosynthesis
MRLLLLDQFSDLGGAQQVLLELLPAIRRRGWEVLIGLPGQGELFPRARSLGFEVARITCGPFTSGRKSLADGARLIAQAPRLAREIRNLAGRAGADLVYINGPRLLPAAALAGLHTPVLFHSHSYLSPGPVRKLAGSSLRRMGAGVLGCCRFVADLWRDFVPAERISVVYNGVSNEPVAGKQPDGSRYSIGCIGRIAPEKGQLEFVAAASTIHRHLPNCRFLVYGAPLFDDESAHQYDAAVRLAAAGLPVEFAGWTRDVHQALASLDLLLVPSAAHEATPRVILEAFTVGVPVIAFPSGGIPELIEDGRTGFLATSPEAMARLAVDLLSGERERLAAVSRAAGAAWTRKFQLDRFHREILDHMEEAACRG